MTARRQSDALDDELVAISAMSVGELHERYEQLFGGPSRSRNRAFLLKKLMYRVQELREGGLDDEARARARELARDTPLRVRPPRPSPAAPGADTGEQGGITRDPRLPPPGTVLRKEHAGTVHEITVLEAAFEHAGTRYRSLSRVAKEITGTSWNGFLWLGLTQRNCGRRRDEEARR